MMAKRFSELANKVRADDARRRRVAAYKKELLTALALADLRHARRMTQAELAKALKTTQSGVSRLEHQADLYLSTLRSYVEALGGRLEIYGAFPDARLPIASFGDLAASGPESGPETLLPLVELPVKHGPLPLPAMRQDGASALAAASVAEVDAYYVHESSVGSEVLGKLGRNLGTDSLYIEWVRLSPWLEGAVARIQARATDGTTYEVDVPSVRQGERTTIRQGAQVSPGQLASLTLELVEGGEERPTDAD
jgi:transcriptional regulator with XRE-family HTH domain